MTRKAGQPAAAKRPERRRASATKPAKKRTAPAPRAAAVSEGTATAAALPIVVGIGASAGGLEAFSNLLRRLPADSNLAVVFVQHLAPQHESALVTLLSAQSAMPVVQAEEGMRVEANHVYVIPPNRQLVISGHELHVGPRPDDRSQYNPVDAFLGSLARSAGRRAVGVVLSGTASDGAMGIRDIKAAGGLTLAQTPQTAKYDGMPRAAIATGMVDLVLAPEQIGAQLTQFAARASLGPAEGGELAPEVGLTDEQMQELFALLRPVSGIDFRHYKPPTITRRLYRRMALQRLTDPDDYLRMLRQDPAEVRSLSHDLLIHVTRFFREPDSFDAIAAEVFPALLEGRAHDQPIRVWVSGCATGEEAYSLAILLVEFLQKRNSDIRVQIFATDVSDAAIEHARTGTYPGSIEADVSADRLRRFFTKQDGGYRVTKMIRDLCVFARQDLTRDPPFSRLDLILCRNVLIYMDLVLQKKLLSIFHYALVPNGFLVLGHAETVGAQATLFSLVDKRYRIHRKRATGHAPAMTFPVDYSAAAVTISKKVHHDSVSVEKVLQTEVTRIINDRFAPPGVIVDGEMQIVQFRGQTGAFLEPAPGEASLNLLKMAKEGLLYGLRSAINAARKSRAPVRRNDLQVRDGKSWARVDLEVIPLSATGRMHYLVLFEPQAQRRGSAPPPPGASAPPPRGNRQSKSQLHFLERELAASREYLQSVIQELEAANEELQSANEEILSSNEELQSTNEELDTAKEELQSTNEELNTVNEELHGRNEELSRVNSDLMNLLGSVQIAIVIVGADMRIRRFTPMAEKVLNLIPSDVDRSIGHINPNIEGANLEPMIAECIDSISAIEREVQDRQGRWYSLRIRPYRSAENKIEGAVLALFDIDTPKRYEASVRSALDLAEALLQNAPRPAALLDFALRLRSANQHFVELFGLSADGLRGRALTELSRGGDGLEELVARGAGEAASDGMTLTLRPSQLPDGVAFLARTFAAQDGTSGGVVLLTAADASAPRAAGE
jgi:two-component system CheB/CheR fusion protein